MLAGDDNREFLASSSAGEESSPGPSAPGSLNQSVACSWTKRTCLFTLSSMNNNSWRFPNLTRVE